MPIRTFFLGLLIAAANTATAPGQSPATPPPSPEATPTPPASAAPATAAPDSPTAPSPSAKPAAAGREAHERIIRDALQNLPPEKRRQVLEAMKSVWADEDVRAAREDLRKATETYRRTLRTAMEETDPDVRTTLRPLIDRLLKAGFNASTWNDTPSTTPLPSADPASTRPLEAPPRYLRLLGLSGNKLATLSPENRALIGSVRDRVMNDPRVRQAAAAVATKSDQPKARAQAMQDLRRLTRMVAIELEPRLASILEAPGATRQ